MTTPFFDRFSPSIGSKLLAGARTRHFVRGEIIFHQDDPADAALIVQSGRVAIQFTTALGELATLTVVGRGSLIGELSLMNPGKRRSASARAMVPSELLSLRHSVLQEIATAEPTVWKVMAELLAERVVALSDDLVEALYLPADRRVLRRLIGLLPPAAEGHASVVASQDMLASMAGTARPTANRALQDAAARGLITIARGRIDVVDIEKLRRRAYRQ